MEKPILVTGVAGFIGWRVAKFLLEDSFYVIGVNYLGDKLQGLVRSLYHY